MQESNARAPIDTSEDPAAQVEPGATTAGPQRRPGRPPRKADPVIQWLTAAIVGIIIVWLIGVVSALLFGPLAPAQAPRTAAERDLGVLAAQVQSGKANTQTYARYVATLIGAGQLSRAQSALDQAVKTVKKDKSYLLAQQAQLDLATKNYQAAVSDADKTMAEAQKELAAYQQANIAANRYKDAGAFLPTSYTDAAMTKANAYMASNDYKSEIKALDVYLQKQPIDAGALVQRAQAKLKVGDKKGAEEDFRAALKYVPDLQPALDGLKQMGAGK